MLFASEKNYSSVNKKNILVNCTINIKQQRVEYDGYYLYLRTQYPYFVELKVLKNFDYVITRIDSVLFIIGDMLLTISSPYIKN